MPPQAFSLYINLVCLINRSAINPVIGDTGYIFFYKNISLCPLPLNTNLNYVNASDKNQQNSVFNLTRKRPESKALNLCMWVAGWIGNLGDARIFVTRHISSQFEEKKLMLDKQLFV